MAPYYITNDPLAARQFWRDRGFTVTGYYRDWQQFMRYHPLPFGRPRLP